MVHVAVAQFASGEDKERNPAEAGRLVGDSRSWTGSPHAEMPGSTLDVLCEILETT